MAGQRSSLWCLRGRIGSLLLAAQGALALYDFQHHIESARLYGNIDYYAYYYVDLLVGTPPQRVSVILDTGSGVCAFPCANCGHCGTHIDPAFDFSKSTTSSWVPCGSGCLGTCRSNRCAYHQGYTEGSSISGFVFQDRVHLGDTIQRNPAVTARMGCHDNENNLFYTQKANGILGIGPPNRGGARSMLKSLYEDKKHIDTQTFAICLAEWGGRFVVGGHNSSYHRGEIQWIDLQTSSGYYHVTMSSAWLNGQQVASDFKRSMIDSGTTYTYMAATPYKALRKAIEDHCRRSGCGTLSGKCWSNAVLDHFPTLELRFANSVKTSWVPKAYLFHRGDSATWCYAFENDGPGASTVLGASWMVHQEIIFDLTASKVGIVPADCPEYRERPSHHADADLTIPGEDARPLAVAPAPTPRPTRAPTPRPTRAPTPRPTLAPTTAPAARPATQPAPRPTTAPAPEQSSTSTSEEAADVVPVRGVPPVAEDPAKLDGDVFSGGGGGAAGADGVGAGAGAGGLGLDEYSKLAIAGVVGVVSLLACGCVAARRCRSARQHKYIQQLDDETGMPPQIVGSSMNSGGVHKDDLSPGADAFVIDEEELWGEEDAFDYHISGGAGGTGESKGGGRGRGGGGGAWLDLDRAEDETSALDPRGSAAAAAAAAATAGLATSEATSLAHGADGSVGGSSGGLPPAPQGLGHGGGLPGADLDRRPLD